jgi:spore maturation protein CgeB
MKIFFIVNHYEDSLKNLYRENSELQNMSFTQQMSELKSHTLMPGFLWAKALMEQGHEVVYYYSNAYYCQKKWAEENNISYDEKNWEADISVAQIASEKPDILFSIDWSEQYGPQFIERCKKAGAKFVVGWCGEAHPPVTFFKNHNVVFSCDPQNVKNFNQQGLKAFHINHAFSPSIVELVEKENKGENKSIDVGLIGSFLVGKSFHSHRAKIISEILREIPAEVYGRIYMPDKPYIGSLPKKILYHGALKPSFHLLDKLTAKAHQIPGYTTHKNFQENLQFYNDFKLISEHAHAPLYGIEMFKVLKNFKITLNVHSENTPYAGNMRMFESTGMGTCLLTDYKENVDELFIPDEEIVVYKNAGEAKDKIKFLLKNEDVRKKISAAGKARTLKDHNHSKRVQQMMEIITKEID